LVKVRYNDLTSGLAEEYKKINNGYKLAVFKYYGGEKPACVCCNEDCVEMLTIDHINEDGAEHRKEMGKANLYRWLVINGFPDTPPLQVLCYNCNYAKAKNNGICPHKNTN
jgi:hypothetical protein